MPDKPIQNGWNEYSRLVLNEIKRLDNGQAKANATLIEIKEELATLRTIEDDVVTNTQDVKALNSFKAQAVGVFTVVQLLFAAGLTYLLRALG